MKGRTDDSYRVDETYIKVKGKWHYLYRAVDSEGNTLDWMLSTSRDKSAAEKFFRQTLSNSHCIIPRVIGVDENAAYPLAFEAIQNQRLIPIETELRQV